MDIPSMDFETYSEAGYRFDEDRGHFVPILESKPGIAAINAATYAMHPSTRILCLCYDLMRGEGIHTWWPWDAPPADLLEHIGGGGLIEAHNSGFEWYIWHYQCYLKRGWPALPLGQMRCSAAKARIYGLPGALAAVSAYLRPDQAKDTRGKQLIRLLSVPQKPTKNQPLLCRDVYRFPELYAEMGAYCEQDVRAEHAVSTTLPEMSEFELAVWQLDQRINTRGVQIDTDALNACKRIWHQAHDKYTAELRTVTGGEVQTIDEISKGSGGDAWLQSRGVSAPSLDKKNVAKLVARTDLPPDVHRALEIKQLLGSSSAKKIFAIDRILNPDGRIRDLFAYSGAEKTGRWAGRGPQPQNQVNHGPECFRCDCGRMWAVDSECSKSRGPICPSCGGANVSDGHEWGNSGMKAAILDIMSGDLKAVERLWGNAVELIASCIRGLFIAAPGYDLICSDFSAIEAVVLAALAREEWRLEVFRTHGKIYEMSAAKISGIPFETILAHKAETGKHHPLRKAIGKIAELGSGFGGWIGAWKNFGADKFMSDAEIKQSIIKWRDESPNIVEFWGGQWRKHPRKWEWRPEMYGLEGAAVSAVLNPGVQYAHNDIRFYVDQERNVLFLRLPSGRALSYHQPRLDQGVSPAGNPEWKLSFYGRLGDNTGNWGRRDTYGGRITENCVQAVARDIMASAMLRVDAAGYPPVLHVHDEIVSEVPTGFGSVGEFERLMMVREAWFADWPIRAAGGWRGRGYRK